MTFAGSTLYVPVHVPGALLSMGDAHARQGDGEVTLTGIETSVRGTVQVMLRKGMRLNWPRAETRTHYIAMGLHPDLDEASKLATREAIDFLRGVNDLVHHYYPGVAMIAEESTSFAGVTKPPAHGGLGAVYIVIAVWGFIIGNDEFILGFIPVNTEDNFLHLILGVLGIGAGLATPATEGPSPAAPAAA